MQWPNPWFRFWPRTFIVSHLTMYPVCLYNLLSIKVKIPKKKKYLLGMLAITLTGLLLELDKSDASRISVEQIRR